jgi:hypothetical protein
LSHTTDGESTLTDDLPTEQEEHLNDWIHESEHTDGKPAQPEVQPEQHFSGEVTEPEVGHHSDVTQPEKEEESTDQNVDENDEITESDIGITIGDHNPILSSDITDEDHQTSDGTKELDDEVHVTNGEEKEETNKDFMITDDEDGSGDINDENIAVDKSKNQVTVILNNKLL